MKTPLDLQARQSDCSRSTYTTIILMVSIVVSLFIMGCNQDRVLAIREMNSGLEAYQGGNTMDGVRYLREAIKHDPNYPEPHYYLGQIYHLRLREIDNAERHYRQALELEPENAQYAYRLGTVLAIQEKNEEAVQTFRRSVNAMPDYAQSWFRMGLAQQEIGQFTEAVDSYMKAIHAQPRLKMEPSDPGGEHYHALGDLYIRFGLFDQALKVYENGLQNNPEAPRLYHGRGVAQLQLERYDEAERSFTRTLELDGRHNSAVFNLAVSRQAQGKNDEAMEVLERFLQSANRAEDQARIVAAQGLLQQLKERRRE
ncbi:MAG: tetratricopeptide repeat protein [Bradymonadaceae bacterium]